MICWRPETGTTMKMLQIGTPKIITLTVLKLKCLFFQCSNPSPKDADGMKNSVGPDQTAPLGLLL